MTSLVGASHALPVGSLASPLSRDIIHVTSYSSSKGVHDCVCRHVQV